MLGNPGHPRVPPARIHLGHVHLAVTDLQHHPALGGVDQPEQRPHRRRLAAAIGSRQCQHPSGGGGRRQPDRRSQPPPRLIDPHVAPPHPEHRAGPHPGTVGGQRFVDELQSRCRCGDPVRTGVEMQPDHAQRQIDLRGENQHRQTDRQVELAEHQPHPDPHRDQGHADRGEHLQHQPRQERDLQHPLGADPVGLAHLPHPPGLRQCPAQCLQGGQPGNQVEHLIAETAHPGDAVVGESLRGPPDQRHEQRDQGQRARDDRRRQQVLGDHHDEQRRGHQCGRHQLWQVTHQVGVEVRQAGGRQGGQVGG